MMRNIVLFLVSVTVGYLGWLWLENPADRTSEMIKLGVLAALFLPVNIGGNIFTLFGSVYAEKSAYSLFSPFQSAGKDAFGVFGAGYQRAGEDAAVSIGLVGYQRAERTLIIAGLAILQNVKKEANSLFGLVVLQKAGCLYRSFACFSDLQAPAETV